MGDQSSGKGAYTRSNTSSSKGKGKTTHDKHGSGDKSVSDQLHASAKKGQGKTAHVKGLQYADESQDPVENEPELSRKNMVNADAVQTSPSDWVPEVKRW